jgi:hypothetical protein
MNRNPVNQCSSLNCSIYQYRAEAKGNIGVSFLPISPSKDRIDDNGIGSNNKIMSICGNESEGLMDVNSDDLRRGV